MNERKKISDQIEWSRQKLCRLAENQGMQDGQVLQQSMILDELINEYNRFKYNKHILNRQPIT
ncbi:hypothetical protein ASD24_19480 [Paenibacillus sp. Root52]|uniref:Aspartyl-phosphate phosphatase Spo0E family protein n=1 Tax=Paenibacillus amylolyticus TaxID=1451 RepID=A0AAP5H6C5_PAEAM|nr:MULTISPECIES: aspartyl-phosphate phosphatase Spo0E family protein [Paenibacillus]KQY79523.1 hypothetical protein ASD24_19480 [Paenibacillus sp. Root52]MDR6724756.1 hypothetical protein [Paenibacillus amylolyticus]